MSKHDGKDGIEKTTYDKLVYTGTLTMGDNPCFKFTGDVMPPIHVLEFTSEPGKSCLSNW